MTKGTRVLPAAAFMALIVVILVDASGPILLERELDGDAAAAANAGQDAYFTTGRSEDAVVAARAVADAADVTLTRFEVLTGGAVRVTVGKTSDSYFLDRIGPLRKHYVVESTKTAPPRAGAPPTSTTKAG